jgi:hypothetical protein
MVVVFLDSGEAVGAGGNDGGWSSGSPSKNISILSFSKI